MKRLPLWLVLALALVIDTQSAFARFEPPQPCKNSFSLDQEIAQGRKAKASVYRSMPVLPDSSAVSQYVAQLGMKLTKFAPGDAWPYEFHVVNAADINAFALPGGTIFVNLGTVQAAETEAQLAGVLAHEISHVVMRHATCNQSKQRRQSWAWGLAQLGAAIALPDIAGAAAQVGLAAWENGLGLKMSREDERQADLMGTGILYDAGYDPRGLPQFFEVIEGRYGKGGKEWLSDHPNPGNRTGYVNAEIDSLPPKANLVRTSDEFTAIKQQISGRHAYTAKEIAAGTWRKDPQPIGPDLDASVFTPSEQWQDLQDTGFSLRHPANWQVYDGPGTAVTVAPAAGLASTSNGEKAVLCGALVDLYQPQKGSDLTSAAGQLVQYLTQGNTGLQPRAAMEDVVVNQRPAKSVELLNPRKLDFQAAEHDWLVALERKDGSLQYVVFVAPANAFETLRPSFEQMLHSFNIRD
jgi:Zn-dependent protease with chaperone function